MPNTGPQSFMEIRQCNAQIRVRTTCLPSVHDSITIFSVLKVLPCYVITLVPRESRVSVDENLSKTLEKARETKDERLQRITARVIG